MAIETLRFSNMEDQLAVHEAASAGLKGMNHLINLISHQNQSSSLSSSSNQLDCREITDFTVAKFKKVISVLNRTGHARFRRAPISSSSSPSTSSCDSQVPTPIVAKPIVIAKPSFVQSQTTTLDFSKPNLVISNTNPKIIETPVVSLNQSLSMSATGSSSFMSSITGEGSVSNGKLGLSLFSTPTGSSNFLTSINGEGSVSNGKLGLSLFSAPTPAVLSGKPTLLTSQKKRCHDHDPSEKISGSEKCPCSKKRKSKMKKTIKVPAISNKVADIPADDYSWRKYGQKPIKGSPYPRGYYKCSTLKGCPANKHVERDPNDPTMLIVNYYGEHRHTEYASQRKIADGVGVVA